MSSIGGMFSIARTALLAQQSAMEVAGHNLANAQTEGYSRQDLLLGAGTSLRTPLGNFGTGVRAVTVQRSRDALLDQDVRAQSAPASGFALRRDILTRVEGVLGEPSDTGIASALDAFWNAWSDLASNPTNIGARSVVQQTALSLTSRLNRAATELDLIATNTRAQIGNEVGQVNRLTAQIAELNGRIIPAESSGHTANDLRDQRDMLIDQLSEIVPVTVIDKMNGGNEVLLGGRPLVDGIVAKQVETSPGTPLTLRFVGETEAVLTMGGRLGALIGVVNNEIPAVLASLDQIAAGLVADVNAIHATGWSPPLGAAGNWDPLLGPTGSGQVFFDDTPVNATARNIRLAAPIAADAGAIAVSDALDAPGNNAIAIAISSLRDFAPSPAGNSFAGTLRTTVSSIASAVRVATDSATVASTVADQARARRASVSEVSTDEELMRLMKCQQAYAAAAKVVQAIDEMSQILIDLKR